MVCCWQEESMRAFVTPETLNGNNQYFCEKCDKKCDAHKVCLSYMYCICCNITVLSIWNQSSCDVTFRWCFRAWSLPHFPICWRCSWSGSISTTRRCIESNWITGSVLDSENDPKPTSRDITMWWRHSRVFCGTAAVLVIHEIVSMLSA